MNKRIKQIWIDALISNKYKQGYNRLKAIENNEESYCAIGVLFDALKEELHLNYIELPIFDKTHIYGIDISKSFVLLPFKRKYNNDHDVVLEGYCELKDFEINTIISMNDKFQFKFREISDYIKKYL